VTWSRITCRYGRHICTAFGNTSTSWNVVFWAYWGLWYVIRVCTRQFARLRARCVEQVVIEEPL